MPLTNVRNQFDPGAVNGSSLNGVGAFNEISEFAIRSIPANTLVIGAWLNPLFGNFQGASFTAHSVAGTKGRVGIYNVNPSNGRPGSIITQTGDMPTTSLGSKFGTFPRLFPLTSKWYYMAMARDSTGDMRVSSLKGPQGPIGYFTFLATIVPITLFTFALTPGWMELPLNLTGASLSVSALDMTFHTLTTP